jgi:hypothetical protein
MKIHLRRCNQLEIKIVFITIIVDNFPFYYALYVRNSYRTMFHET